MFGKIFFGWPMRRFSSDFSRKALTPCPKPQITKLLYKPVSGALKKRRINGQRPGTSNGSGDTCLLLNMDVVRQANHDALVLFGLFELLVNKISTSQLKAHVF